MKVESTISGMLRLRAIFAYPSMSATSSEGFPTASMYNARVCSFMDFSTAEKSFTSVKRAVIEYCGKMASKSVYVPPYRLRALTSSSPAFSMFKMLNAMAAVPEESASAPAPPSSAQSRFSRISLVGFIILE